MTGNLSNVQVEILKLYSTDMEDDQLIELKDMLAKFFASKSVELADAVWNDKSLTNDDMDVWLHEKS